MKKPILKIKMSGKGIWGDTRGLVANVTDYEFKRDNMTLKVHHNLPWDIYTDKTFESEITKFIKKKHPELNVDFIMFSEQGLQRNYIADMDVILKRR